MKSLWGNKPEKNQKSWFDSLRWRSISYFWWSLLLFELGSWRSPSFHCPISYLLGWRKKVSSHWYITRTDIEGSIPTIMSFVESSEITGVPISFISVSKSIFFLPTQMKQFQLHLFQRLSPKRVTIGMFQLQENIC